MQEFFMNYGLWLLVGLLVIIALVFLLAGRGKADVRGEDAQVAALKASAPDTAPVPTAPVRAPVAEPVASPAPEPVIAVESVVAPTTIPTSPSVAMPAGEGDNLLRMKGVGPKLNQQLIDLGVTRYAQIANWTDADIAAIDGKLGNFKGRPVRDQWVDQAKYLAAGDLAGFEAKYGKL
ncbi:hypothetical protein [Sphingobium sp. ZW T5_29]|uniref:hypothetical protein n=1 Tax=Sphingobium sp. ZW T5_29 TaxID=3378077 RepID=UPI003852D34F